MPLHLSTPLIHSSALSAKSGREVWLKMEALQPPGSFKLRGVGHACETHAARRARRFVSSSGGNAGLAVAHAGRRLGVPVLVVVPESTSARARELLLAEGAELVVEGASWQEAHAHATSLIGADDAFIHPFDDPLLWRGHASMIDEVVAAGLRPEAVVLSVGGGGLMCGVATGLQRAGLDAVPIIAVETEGAASLRAAHVAGHAVELPAIQTVATSLGARRVCDEAVQWMKRRPVTPVLVTDAQAVTACLEFLDDQRVLVEPACGAALSLVHRRHPVLDGFDKVLVIVCGGATATLAQLQAWRDAIKT